MQQFHLTLASIRISQKGFTLVETLVAVAILMVAIAGPLSIANQSLTAALGSRNAMIATYLAQDGMESIKNIKDNALSVVDRGGIAPDFNTMFKGCPVNTKCPIPELLVLNLDAPVYALNCDLSTTHCKLFVDDSEGTQQLMYFYSESPVNGLRATPFTRYYSYSAPVTNGSNSNQETVVTVHVSWNDGAVPNEIILQELMTNVVRN